jgi:hypothetical protein
VGNGQDLSAEIYFTQDTCRCQYFKKTGQRNFLRSMTTEASTVEVLKGDKLLEFAPIVDLGMQKSSQRVHARPRRTASRSSTIPEPENVSVSVSPAMSGESPHKEDVSPDELKKRAEAFMKQQAQR